MEIYNEAVRDLLNPESTQLRILDDPEVHIILSLKTNEVEPNGCKHLNLICSFFCRKEPLLRNLWRRL